MLRVLTVALTLFAPALAEAEATAMKHGRPAATAAPSDKAYAAAMDRMMTDMGAKPTGNPDRDFVTMMLPHHRGAVEMAQVELKYGKDPTLLAMARAIVESQGKEIDEMHAWQKANGH